MSFNIAQGSLKDEKRCALLRKEFKDTPRWRLSGTGSRAGF
jgi:hypothetical protein